MEPRQLGGSEATALGGCRVRVTQGSAFWLVDFRLILGCEGSEKWQPIYKTG